MSSSTNPWNMYLATILLVGILAAFISTLIVRDWTTAIILAMTIVASCGAVIRGVRWKA